MNHKMIKKVIQCYENNNQKAVLGFWKKQRLNWVKLNDAHAYKLFMNIYTAPLSLSDKGLISSNISTLSILQTEKVNEQLERLNIGPNYNENMQTNFIFLSLVIKIKINKWNFLFSDISNAVSHKNLGKTYFSQNLLIESEEAYSNSLAIYNKPRLKKLKELDAVRAQTYVRRGNSRTDNGNLKLAFQDYDKAFKIFDLPHLKDNELFDKSRALLHMDYGIACEDNWDMNKAITNYSLGIRILELPHLQKIREYDVTRALLLGNRGNAYEINGNLTDALNDYNQTEKLYNLQHLKHLKEFDHNRALTYTNRAIAYLNKGDLTKAINDSDKALEYFDKPHLKNLQQYKSTIAKMYNTYGNIHLEKSNFEQALNYYDQALTVLNQLDRDQFPQYEHERGRLHMNHAIICFHIGDISTSLLDCDRAELIFNSSDLLNKAQHDISRATICVTRGSVKFKIGSLKSALTEFEKAIKLYERVGVSETLSFNRDRTKLYSNSAALLSLHSDPLTWSRDKSARLVNLLELAPFARHDSVDHPMWREMRSNFALFHARWLKYCIDEGYYDEIPRILFTVQGRELVREVYEELREFDPDTAHPESVIRFFELRRQLREMLNRQPGMDSSLGGGFDDITRGPQRLDPEQANAQYLAQLDAHQRQYQALHTQMRDVQAKAALEKGYEDLAQQDHDHGLDDLINLSGFTDRQALLLMVDYQAGNSNEGNQSTGGGGLLLITKDGDCQWLGAEFLGDISDQMIRLRRTLETDSMRGPLRRDISGDVNAETDSDDFFVPLTASERHRFWPQMVKQLKAQLWQPILDQLADKSIDEIIIMPQGRWHQMPIEAGAPEDVSIRYYPGLVFYGLAQGLFGSPRDTSADIDVNRQAFGLVAYSAMDHLNTTLALPGVEQEVKALETLYAEGSCRLKSPEEFPEQPRSIEMFHFAGHGNTDPGNDSSTALLVGYDHERKSDQYVGMHALRKGKTNVKYALINACVTGEIKENQHGTPSGIVTGLLRQGTQSVTAALYPLNDTYAVVFGEAFQRLWRQERQETGNVDVHCILKQSIDELIERGQIRVREDVNQALYSIVESELEGYDEVRPDYIAKIIEDLVNYQPVLVPYADEIKATLTTITSCDDMKPRLDDLMHHLDDQGAFQFDPEHRLPDDLGMITHGLRVFG